MQRGNGMVLNRAFLTVNLGRRIVNFKPASGPECSFTLFLLNCHITARLQRYHLEKEKIMSKETSNEINADG